MDHTVFVIKIPEFYPEAVCVLYIIIIIIIINMTQICSSRSTTDRLITAENETDRQTKSPQK